MIGGGSTTLVVLVLVVVLRYTLFPVRGVETNGRRNGILSAQKRLIKQN